MTRYVAAAAMLVIAGCGLIPGTDGTVCTTNFVFGINVRVEDENGDPVTGADLTLADGDFTESLDELADGQYVGAGERAGTYTLLVEADGFESQTIEDIVVEEDECHVIPEIRTITLVPE